MPSNSLIVHITVCKQHCVYTIFNYTYTFWGQAHTLTQPFALWELQSVWFKWWFLKTHN